MSKNQKGQRSTPSRPNDVIAKASAERVVATLTGEDGTRATSARSVVAEFGRLPNRQFLVGELSAVTANAVSGTRVAQGYLTGTTYRLRAFVCVGDDKWHCYERVLSAPVSDERVNNRRGSGRQVRRTYEWV